MDSIRACTAQEADVIKTDLRAYSMAALNNPEMERTQEINLVAEDRDGAVIAGILAEQYFGSYAFVSRLWVSAAARGKGLGSRLLQEVEHRAKAAGCTIIHLDTFDFQAKRFYEKLGYSVFGVLDDCPPGHRRYFF